MPITAVDISEYLQTRSDFDLELFVCRALRERGYVTAHGGTYIDPAKGIPRQFDVRAHAQIHKQFGIELAVECKSLSVDAPLLVSRVPRTETEAYHELVHSWPRNNQRGAYARSIRHQGDRDYYRPDHLVGKRTAQVRRNANGVGFKDDDRDPYEKWSQALASAGDLVNHAANAGAGAVPHFYSFIVPVLVVSDGALWAVDYREDGQQTGDARPIDALELFVERDYPISVPNYAETSIYHVSHLHICTRVGFSGFLQKVATSDRELELIFGFALWEQR